ncbi:MAG: hypothetical protein Q9213_007599 [Squamulea squamosa]
MSLKPLDLTTALRPSLYPDESLLFVQDAVGLYEGKFKIPAFQNGHAYLTSHRACYVDNVEPRKSSVAIELKEVERYGFYAGFFKSSPKVTLHLKYSKRPSFSNHGRAATSASVQTGHPAAPTSPKSYTNRASSPFTDSQPQASTPRANNATWICPICSYSNPVASNFDAASANVHTPLAPCLACGIKPPLAHILKAVIANASGRSNTNHSPVRSSFSSPHTGAASGFSSSHGFAANGLTSPAANLKFQCPRCTFQNHPSLLECELCGASLISVEDLHSPVATFAPIRPESPGPSLDSQVSNLDQEANEIKFSFRDGGDKIFYERLKGAMTQRKWLLQNAPPIPKPDQSSPYSGSDGRTSQTPPKVVGIAGLERRGLELRKNNETVIGSAFEDLEALMASAKEVVALAEQFAHKSADHGSEGDALLVESATALGMVTTKAMLGSSSGSESLYLSELSRNVAEYLTDDAKGVLKKEGGIVSLVDLWAIFNRTRGGAELVSPADFDKAARLWDKLGLPVRLRQFKNGLLVVQRHDWTDDKTIAQLLAWLQELHTVAPGGNVGWDWRAFGRGVTAQDAAVRFGWSIGVASEELEMAEEKGALFLKGAATIRSRRKEFQNSDIKFDTGFESHLSHPISRSEQKTLLGLQVGVPTAPRFLDQTVAMASARLSSRSNMATAVVLRSFKARVCLTEIRHTRGYCWGKQHRWSYDAYPKPLKSLDPPYRSTSVSDSAHSYYGRSKHDLSSYNYGPASLGGSRASSSWVRWTSNWDTLDRDIQAELKESRDEAAAAYKTLAKDTSEFHELVKRRIDADPFNALFGRSLLFPTRARATWWGVGGCSRGPKTEKQASGTSSKPTRAAGAGGINKQHAIRASNLPSSTQHMSNLSDANPLAGSSPLVEEYDFDPIAMRKVPKKSPERTPVPPTASSASNQTFDIAVKRFEEPSTQEPSPQHMDNGKALDSNLTALQPSEVGPSVSQDTSTVDWLSQEGFGSKEEGISVAGPKSAATTTKVPISKLESALERRTRRVSPDITANRAHPSLTYNAKENTTDDVDLLRASDIRAAAGAPGRLRNNVESGKHEDRKNLEAKFAALRRMEANELEWKIELAAAKKKIQDADTRKRNEARNEVLEKEILAQKTAMEALETRRTSNGVSSFDAAVAHPEQAEGDMASNVHEFVGREHWYKKKAPHATKTEEQESGQITKARSLIREIRGIYEDTYGVIDTKHRQPGSEVSGTKEQNSNISPSSDRGSLAGTPEAVKNVAKSSGPLSTQEKIGTMLQQLLDDSRYLQKLLQTPELTPEIREEIFCRNRSMQNASDAITEALSSKSSSPKQWSQKHVVVSKGQDAADIPGKEPQPVSPSADMKKQSTIYSVLAYDPSIQEVITAEMVSSSESSSERRLSLSEALSSLTEPVKFLPQLTKLQNQGFEVVSSDTNILVLKKNNRTPPTMAADRKKPQSIVNPIDGTRKQTQNVASAKSFVSHDSQVKPLVIEGEQAEQNLSGYKVRREEDVFSGSSGNQWDRSHESNRQHGKSRYRRTSRRRKTTKRMLWVGLWTAGCCYAVGAITEFLRA